MAIAETPATGQALTSDDANIMVDLGEMQTSLADLAGEDLSDIAEQRFSALPSGIFSWEVKSDPAPHLAAVNGKDNKKKAAGIVELTVIDVISLKNPQEAPEGNALNLIGRTHRETFFINPSDVEKSFGYMKAFVKDIGGDNRGACGGVPGKTGFLDAAAGLRFTAPLVHRQDKNDEDKVYVNITRDAKKIKLLPRAAVSSLAAA